MQRCHDCWNMWDWCTCAGARDTVDRTECRRGGLLEGWQELEELARRVWHHGGLGPQSYQQSYALHPSQYPDPEPEYLDPVIEAEKILYESGDRDTNG